jgi:membrane fusion protein (multidrug efflux system)
MASTETVTTPGAVRPTVATARPNRARIVAGVLITTAVVSAGAYRLANAGKESTDDAFVEGRVMPVAARVQGQVSRVLVKDNQAVNEGDLLVELDPADLQARADVAAADLLSAQAQHDASRAQLALAEKNIEANLQQAQGGLGQASGSVESSKASLEQARADVAAAESRLSLADTELKRSTALVATNSVSRADLDNKQAQFDQAKASLEQAKARFLSTRANIDTSVGGVTLAKGRFLAAQTGPQQLAAAQAAVGVAAARVKQAEAAKTLADLNLSYTKLRAPAKGVVARRNVEVGQLVDPSRPLLAVVPLDDVWIIANFKEDQLRDMKPGAKATIEIDAFSGDKLPAHVESLAGGTGSRFALLPPDNASGNFVKVVQRLPVLLRLDAQPSTLQLRPGMSAVVRVTVKE